MALRTGQWTLSDRLRIKRIALLMRRERTVRGWSQIEMARRLGISRATLGRLENEKAAPYAYEWFRFCDLTGVPVDAMCAEED